MKWEPLPYMQAAVEHLVGESYSGLFLKPGMRKTSITLAAYTTLLEAGLCGGMLVIAPLRVCYTSWPQEVKKWDDFKHLSLGILHGKHKDKVLRQKHDIYVINPEGLPWLFSTLQDSWRGKWPFDMLVVDESTKFKNMRTERFRLLKPRLRFFKRRVILTGSPTARHLLDTFGQCYVMDEGKTLGRYITQFRNEYFFPTGFGGYTWVPKQGAEERIYSCLSPRVYYAHDEDWLSLPDLIEKDIEVELPKRAMDIYLQMENTLRLEFEAGRVNAANSSVASMKCRQIANGGIYLDSVEKEWKHIHEAKTDATCDIIEELSGQPALVTYDFLHDLERLKIGIKKVTGEEPPHIGKGGITAANLPSVIRAWNRLEVPVIIVQPQSAALGIDGLQEAGRAVIWHSLTYNAEDDDQLIRRLRRSGQSERVLVARIIAKNTVDRAVIASVRRKDKMQGNLFNALKEYWKT